MTCEEIRALLSEYLDGECDLCDAVSEHLASCPSCKEEYEKLISLKERFKEFVPEPEKSVADGVVAVIRGERVRGKRPFIVRHIGLVASLVIIVIMAVYIRLFPTAEKEELGIGEPSGETVILRAETVDTKNSAVLKSDANYSVTDDALPRDDVMVETVKEVPLCSEPQQDGVADIFEILVEFEVIKDGENTFRVKTEDVQKVRNLLLKNAVECVVRVDGKEVVVVVK